MKARVSFSAIFTSFFFLSSQLLAHVSNGLDGEVNVLTTGYYVVIGAYSVNKETYAQRYASVVNEKGYHASYQAGELCIP